MLLHSIPSLALHCPCGVGNVHITSDLGLWICTDDKKMCGELTSQQHLWLNCVATAIAEPDTHTESTSMDFTCLTESHLPELKPQLKDHTSQWRDIGTYLGFRQGELDIIQLRVHLLQGAPLSYLRAMLSEWFQ